MIWKLLAIVIIVALVVRSMWKRYCEELTRKDYVSPDLLEINGVIEGCDNEDKFFDEFVEWLESKNYKFGGSINKYKEDE